ncbi:MAG: dTDP-4-dehydrorhamnose reductase [Candidatus Magasanikbacteria bacterium]|jgi:dTDP-4-dehydrorhamnose reductase
MSKRNIKKILICGKGQLGQELYNFLRLKYDVEIVDQSKLDITDKEKVSKFINKSLPHCIINAAAYTQVERAEQEVEEAFRVNAYGPYYLAVVAKNVGAILIHISSDYVFDGTKKFFVETDAPNPLNIYGASKLLGEILVQIAYPNYYIFRTSAIFGRYTSQSRTNFVDRIIGLARGGRAIKAVTDQFTSPTYATDLAVKISEFIKKQPPSGIYHITNSGSCSWYDFAVKILSTMNLTTKVKPTKTAKVLGPISRPCYSILHSQLLKNSGFDTLPSWQNALKRYCREKYNI